MSTGPAPKTISVPDALALMNDRKYSAAIAMCDDILEQMPQNATALCIRGRSKWKHGDDPDECIEGIEKALEIAPDSVLVRNYLVEVLVSAGHIDRAKAVLGEALEFSPQNIKTFRELVDITRFSEITPLVQRMVDHYGRAELRQGEIANLGFALAKVFSDLKQPEPAMKYVTEACRAANRDFDVASIRERRDDLEKYAAEFTPTAPVEGGNRGASAPIFIVGMPRSGTTLAETIISRHADVYAGGELGLAPGVERQVNKWLKDYRRIAAGPNTMLHHVPENVWRLNAEQIEEMVGQKTTDEYVRFTDKLPDNAKRLPLLAKLFPDSPIIYVRRHPIDCCLSNLFMQFAHINYSYRQDWLGAYYKDLTETVAISRKLVSNPVFDLSYERLVADPESETRRLVEFVGLDWDEAFLSPEKSDRKTVMTASKWQVRQPIYRDSAAKWKPYEPYLGELIEALGGMDWVEAEVEATALASAG